MRDLFKDTFRACSRAWYISVPAILFFAVAMAAMVREQIIAVEGVRHVLLFDDALISMVYARNLAETGHLAWSGGLAVEGYSSLLWVLVMAAIHVLPLPARLMAAPVLAVNALLVLVASVVSAMVCRRIMKELGHDSRAAAIAPACAMAAVLVDYSFLNWAAQGFEGPLAAVLLGLALLVGSGGGEDRKTGILLGLTMGLTALSRAEMGFFLLGILVVAAVLFRNLRCRFAWAAGVLAGVLGLLIAWRLWVYGSPLPNTYYLKMTGFPHRWRRGLDYVFYFVSMWGAGAYLLASVAPARKSVCAGVALLVAGLFVPYVGYLGGDVFLYFRLYAPVVPLIAALGVAGLAVLMQNPALSQRTGAAILAGMLIVLSFLPGVPPYREMMRRVRDGRPTEHAVRLREAIETAHWLNARTTPEDSVGVLYAGVCGYYLDAKSVDMLGKCEAHIARLTAHGGKLPGHNKFDFAYVANELKPAFILGERRVPGPGEVQGPLDADFAFADALAFSPDIARDYREVPGSYPFAEKRAIYVRRDWWAARQSHTGS